MRHTVESRELHVNACFVKEQSCSAAVCCIDCIPRLGSELICVVCLPPLVFLLQNVFIATAAGNENEDACCSSPGSAGLA